MHKFKIFFLLAFTFLISFPLAFGQQIQKATRPKSSLKKPDREHLANSVIVKMKPQFSKAAPGNVKNEFTSLNKKISVSGMDRMFPNSKPLPKMKTNKFGKPFVDLSRTYILHFSSDLSIEEVINELVLSGKVEYAEPFYTDQVLYLPNDPYADSSTGTAKFYLKAMKYYQALDVEKGNPNVVIGIIDTGVKQDHEDLVDNLALNLNDPINGIDDDNDGYIDNYRGWDLGNNDNNTYNPSSEHGSSVAGTAGATPDNGKGSVGTGFNCKILPIKAATDASGGSIMYGYNGIEYAADHGAKVINLSWGGPGGHSQTAQDVINYAAINHDVVVVAAAGNDGLERYYYPASYDNVLSVGALETKYLPDLDTTVEVRAYFGTYNYAVDVCAQGVEVTGTNHSAEGYSFVESGSSFASPLVAGAAGLLRSHYPSYNAAQISQLLRVTADPLIDTVAENVEFKNGKFGKGRINIFRALTDTQTPAIRMYYDSIYSKYGHQVFGGDTISLIFNFINYLNPTSSANASISVVGTNATIIDGDFSIGSLNTLESISNSSKPYKIHLLPSEVVDDVVIIRIDYSDPATGYSDFQFLTFSINPSYIDIDTNNVTMTITSNSRIGYQDPNLGTGDGFIYKNNQLLYEGGLMISNGSTKVTDAVRGNIGTLNDDFTNLTLQRFTKLSEGDQGASVRFRDKNTIDSIGLIVEQRTYAFHDSPNDNFVIIEYDIQNMSGDTIDTLYVGLYNDWDIMNSAYNKGDWDSQDSIGYVYQANGLYAGVGLLTNNPASCFTLDHSNVGGNNINPNDGFTTIEKYKTLSQGMLRKSGGGSGLGNDVSQVVGTTLFALPNGAKRTVAFAYVAGDNLANLKANARTAKNLFRFYNTSKLPVLADFNFCKGDTVDVTLTPSVGTKFAFYNSPNSATPIKVGTSLTLNDVSKSDTIFIAGQDSIFESSRLPVKITLHADVSASYGYFPKTVNLDVTPNGLAYFISTSHGSSTLTWNMGDGTIVNNVSELGHNYTLPGIYKVLLTAKDSYNCVDTVSHIVQVTGTPSGIMDEFDKDGLIVYPNPVKDQLIIHIQQNSPNPVSIEIYNSLGQKINQVTSNESLLEKKFNIPVNSSEKGMHYAKIDLGGRIITRKFVIE